MLWHHSTTETPKIWKDEQNSKLHIPDSVTTAGHCISLQLGKLAAQFMLRVSHFNDFSIFCSARVRSHHLPKNFSSPYFQWETQALSVPTQSVRSLGGHQTKPSSHVQSLAASVLFLRVSWARNGLKLSGQQQKQRSWTSFHANDLSVASCSFTVLLSARAPGPSKPGARF